MFRASTDGGKTFGEKMNPSNSPHVNSQEVEIATFGNNDTTIIVTLWERNQTINESMFRISSDNGKTFEPHRSFQLMTLLVPIVVLADSPKTIHFLSNKIIQFIWVPS